MSVVEDGHVGEEVVRYLCLPDHVDVLLEDVPVLVCRSPKRSACKHLGVVHYGGDGAGLVVGAVVGGVHVLISIDVDGAEQVVPVAVVVLQSHQAVFHLEYVAPLSEQLGHRCRASGLDEVGVHVEELIVGLHLYRGALHQVCLHVSPVVVVVALREVEVAIDCTAFDVYGDCGIAVDAGEGCFAVGGVVHLIVDEAVAAACHQ